MSEGPFQSLDLTAALVGLEQLFEQVIRNTGRIEITRDGSDETCVLISLEELRGLEKALEILSNNDCVAELRQEVVRIADSLSPRHAVAASGAA